MPPLGLDFLELLAFKVHAVWRLAADDSFHSYSWDGSFMIIFSPLSIKRP
jgi:hypothetical protein